MLLGDGTVGWREYAPYDAILVSAGGPTHSRSPWSISSPTAAGCSCPSGAKEEQVLKLVVRSAGTRVRSPRDVAPVRFVPLFGMHGWEQG